MVIPFLWSAFTFLCLGRNRLPLALYPGNHFSLLEDLKTSGRTAAPLHLLGKFCAVFELYALPDESLATNVMNDNSMRLVSNMFFDAKDKLCVSQIQSSKCKTQNVKLR
jgi:hypothetical protein